MKPNPQKLSWLDMIVADPDKTSRFYEQVAGLEREAVPEDKTHTSYSLKNSRGQEVLGICDAAVFDNWVPGWLPYLDIPNFEKGISKVVSSGGTILRELTFDYNWKGQRFCLVRDPSGAPLMLCEQKPEESNDAG